MKAPSGDAGEELFEQYLSQWGYTDYERHPEWLNPPKKPDYLIAAPSGPAVVEVKSFTTLGLFENAKPGMAMSRSQKDSLRPVRSAITKAAGQLKGIEDRPLIVVLANPLNCPLPLNEPMIISAMYGDLSFTFPADQDQPGYWQPGRNGRLHLIDEQRAERGSHDYISAVAVVRDGVKAWADTWWEEHGESYESPAAALHDMDTAWREAPEPKPTLDVFETVSDRCVPLPADLFFHHGDTRWGVIAPGEYGLKATAAV